jgi:hypothetical protein
VIESFDIFLCHSGSNKDFIRELATALEAEQIDGRSVRVFFDEWDIAPGENILTRIEDGLRGARLVAVALSPALTCASWPTMEWQSQVYDDPHGKRARIIPLIIEKFDPQTMEPLDIPLPLRLLRYLDFSRPSWCSCTGRASFDKLTPNQKKILAPRVRAYGRKVRMRR